MSFLHFMNKYRHINNVDFIWTILRIPGIYHSHIGQLNLKLNKNHDSGKTLGIFC